MQLTGAQIDGLITRFDLNVLIQRALCILSSHHWQQLKPITAFVSHKDVLYEPVNTHDALNVHRFAESPMETRATLQTHPLQRLRHTVSLSCLSDSLQG